MTGTRLLTLAALAASTALGSAQTPALLRDVNTAPPPEPSAWPGEFAAFGGHVYFEAATPTTGRELFRTDGSAAGTSLFHEFVPGPGDGRLGSLTPLGNLLFFGATDELHGAELWVTDGTGPGTRLVLDIVPGPGDSGPYHLTAFAGRLFFRALGPTGIELWSSDGSAGGTRPFFDLRPGSSSSMPEHLTVLGNRLFFVANDGVNGAEPWVTDGTVAGTRLLADAYPGSTESGAEPLAALGGQLVFRTYNGPHPLWITDGTPAGTRPIPTALTGVRYTRAVLGNTLLFGGYEPGTGEELWRTDGTPQGTARVLDIVPGSGSSQPWLLGVVGGRAVLTVERNRTTELWVSDGTSAGTTFVTALDVWPNFGVELGGALLMRADDRAHGEELWRTDGTAAGTWLVADAWPGTRGSVPAFWTRFGNHVVYAARDDLGGEPWITDGTAAGTHQIANVGSNPPGWTADSNPGDSTDWNGQLVFAATTSRTDPWRSDGTRNGTALYHAFPGPDPFIQLNEDGNPRLYTARGELVSVVGTYPSWDLWVDGGAGPVRGGPIVLNGSSRPLAGSAAAGGLLWLASHDLWRVDRGVPTLVPIASGQPSNPNEPTRVGASALLFAHDGSSYGLYRCDAGGCTRVVALASGSGWQMIAVRDRAYFQAQDPATGQELWVTDGTAAGTRVLDLVPGPSGSQAYPLTAQGDALLFLANDSAHGWEVWATQGTLGSTVRLTDLPGDASPYSFEFARLGAERIAFVHDDGVHGSEPWVLSPAGASMVVDLWPGASGSEPEMLGAAGEEAWFTTRAPQPALWRTDGTPAGTIRLLVGVEHTRWFDVVAGKVYFDHDDGVLGREPWTASAGATAEPVGEACGVGLRAPWLESTDPLLGRTWVVRGGGGPPRSLGLLVLGHPSPRPALLAGGCTSYVDAGSLAVIHVVPDASVHWTWQLALPNLTALVGAQLVAQTWVGPSANPSGVELSNGIWLSLDSR